MYKYYNFVYLCLAILFLILSKTLYLQNTSIRYEGKIISHEQLNRLNDDNGINVIIKFKDELHMELSQFQNQVELTDSIIETKKTLIQNEFLKEKYNAINQYQLSKYQTYVKSAYTPFSILKYPDLESFKLDGSLFNNLKTDSTIDKIYIEKDYEYEEYSTTRNTEAHPYDYEWEDVLEDVGLTNVTYTGNGIKIGIIERKHPANLNTHFDINKIHFQNPGGYPNASGIHAYNVATILGGDYGIASGADYYFSTVTEASDEIEGMEYLIDNNVHIINRTIGSPAYTYYNWLTEYYDYLVNNLHITIVTASGNAIVNPPGSTPTPSKALNVISVGATSSNHKVWFKSSRSTDEKIKNPTLSAPGEKLTNIPYFDYSESTGTGTSFSTPIVSAIIALLIEEFPSKIKYYPERIIAALISSTTPLVNQTTNWDQYCGAGLVNYENARSVLQKTSYKTIDNDTGESNDIIFQEIIHVAANSTAVVSLFNLYGLAYFEPPENESVFPHINLIITQYKLEVFDSQMNPYASDGTQKNMRFISIENAENFNQAYIVRITQTSTRYLDETEKLVLASFNLDYPTSSFNHIKINGLCSCYDIHDHYMAAFQTGSIAYHRMECICGYNYNESHTWGIIDGITKCTKCGMRGLGEF